MRFARGRKGEARMWKLVDGTGRAYPLVEGLNAVGRGGSNHVDLSGMGAVSRSHAIIVVTGENVSIEDIGSKNGVRVGDGEKLSPGQQAQVTNGQTIWFGQDVGLILVRSKADLDDLTITINS